MKIFIAGDGHSDLHELAMYKAFKKLEHKVFFFGWNKHFRSNNPAINLFRRIQFKFILGPQINHINNMFIEALIRFKPDLIFIYRGTHIKPQTLNKIKFLFPNVTLCGYNNDDPFSSGYGYYIWRNFINSIPSYDLIFSYRPRNIKDYKKAGAKSVALLRSWFIPNKHYNLMLSDKDQLTYNCDVVFVGHYENDGRLEFLEEIVRAGYKLNLFGHGYGWNKHIKKSLSLQHLYPIKNVWNINYCKALSGAKIGLCFLSKLNNDSYTRRCFEIPATKTLLLSEFSNDLATIFTEGVDADFFRNKNELVNKVKFYIENENIRTKIAQNGYKRVVADKHDILSRVKYVLNVALNLNS